MFLSSFLIINTTTATIANVTPYIIKLSFQFPFSKLAPANVEDITDGNLANVDISINSVGFIGSNAAIYVSKSFGVPGIKNNIKSIFRQTDQKIQKKM